MKSYSFLSVASGSILVFKLTFIVISVIFSQYPNSFVELEVSSAEQSANKIHDTKLSPSFSKILTEKGFRSRNSPQDAFRIKNNVHESAHRLSHKQLEAPLARKIHSKEKKIYHTYPHILATSGLDDDDRAANSTEKIEARPLSWDKSWWSFGAWLLWFLSCVTPTILIFVLNGMTQASSITIDLVIMHQDIPSGSAFLIHQD